MAASDAIPVPRKAAAYRFYFAIRDNTGALVTTWAGQDSEISKDGGNFGDCENEATEIQTSGCGYIDLTATEMTADCVVLKVTVTNANALPLVFTLFPETAGDYRVADSQKVDVNTIKTQTVTCGAGVTVLASVGTASTSTAQTGDVYARLGAPAGASVSADIAALPTSDDIDALPTAEEIAAEVDTVLTDNGSVRLLVTDVE